MSDVMISLQWQFDKLIFLISYCLVLNTGYKIHSDPNKKIVISIIKN